MIPCIRGKRAPHSRFALISVGCRLINAGHETQINTDEKQKQ
jgi:hypothetical protein